MAIHGLLLIFPNDITLSICNTRSGSRLQDARPLGMLGVLLVLLSVLAQVELSEHNVSMQFSPKSCRMCVLCAVAERACRDNSSII